MTIAEETRAVLLPFRQESGSVYVYEASFPVSVKVRRANGDVQRWDTARTMVVLRPDGGSQLLVWHLGRTGIELVINESVTPGSSRFYETDEGDVYSMAPGPGCGCGNVLKTWSPARVSELTISRVARPVMI